VVKACGEGFYSVSNGNRRLAAFHMIYSPDSSEPIRCTLRDVDEDGAFEDSLTTAVTAKQLHPVDQYEAFARLRDGRTRRRRDRQPVRHERSRGRAGAGAGPSVADDPRSLAQGRDQGRRRQGVHAGAGPQGAGRHPGGFSPNAAAALPASRITTSSSR
jgi:hypothetical protein